MTRSVEKISLKRLSKKLWQYADKEPKRVELAVLDYLKGNGWRGYFTEHFNFDETLLMMMCWCNRNSYFQEKRKSLRVNSVKEAFDFASDGYWQHDAHKLTHAELIQNAKTFSEAMIPHILKHWQERGVKSQCIGRAYFKDRSADELHADDLVSFFHARGGIQYFVDYLEYFHGAVHQQLKQRARDLRAQFSLTGRERDLLDRAGTYLQIYSDARGQPTSRSIHNWINAIQSDAEESREAFLTLAKDIKKYWESREVAENRWTKTAYLDLTIWKDSVASVEVKAPNDRLQSHQVKQLALDEAYNRTSWVIEVFAI